MSRVISCFLFVCYITICWSYPNVVFVFVDDLGWNDLGYQGVESAAKTPNIDELVAGGVKLDNYYVQPTCSPSRTAFLTGKYPYKLGVLEPFNQNEASCVPDVTMLSQTLQSFGYNTHLVGKWHLGTCKESCLPTSRGFDTFYGYYNGAKDYYDHTVAKGYDWHMDNSSGRHVLWDEQTDYSVTLMDTYVEDLISNHDKATPFFLYWAMQSVHSPIQPLAEDVAEFASISDPARRDYLALVKGVDDSMGVLMKALKKKKIKKETIVIFSSDNGGSNGDGANNWPLSGVKGFWFEGGTKVGGFVNYSPMSQANASADGLMHASDWFPTIISAIGETLPSGLNLDGFDQWDHISNGGVAPRTELVYDIDTRETGDRPYGTIRQGDMKLISAKEGKKHERTAPPESSEISETTGLSTDGVQLYNLTADPFERDNLAFRASHRVLRLALFDLLTTYRNASDVIPNVHVAVNKAAAVLDANGAYTTNWC